MQVQRLEPVPMENKEVASLQTRQIGHQGDLHTHP